MNIETIVSQCYHGCPFFELDGGPSPMMICGHPFWRNQAPYAGAIITQDNSHGRVPALCPLRQEPTITTITLKEGARS